MVRRYMAVTAVAIAACDLDATLGPETLASFLSGWLMARGQGFCLGLQQPRTKGLCIIKIHPCPQASCLRSCTASRWVSTHLQHHSEAVRQPPLWEEHCPRRRLDKASSLPQLRMGRSCAAPSRPWSSGAERSAPLGQQEGAGQQPLHLMRL